MTTDQNRIVALVVRYGLPALVLVFYLTAVRHFDYTPDSTYATAQVAQNVEHWNMFAGPVDLAENVSPSPLWIFLQVAGIRASFDVILFAKVFGIFFCCTILVFGYLTAFELTDDRLLAFCATFVIATCAWLLYVAPTGNALPIAAALTLGCIFFLLRNEYVLSTLFAGLASLVLWEGAVLFVLLLLDLMLNSVIRQRACRIAGIALGMYVVVVVPWLLYARHHGDPVIPALVPVGGIPVAGPLAVISTVLLAALGVAGVALMFRHTDGTIYIRTHATPIVWTALMLTGGILGSWERIVLGAPLLAIGAFVGIQRGLRAVGRGRAIYLAAFGLAAAMLLMNQVTYLGRLRPAIQPSMESSRDLDAIASWLKINSGDSLRVAAEHPGELGYRSGRVVERLRPGSDPPPDIVITSAGAVPGYVRQYVVSPDSALLPPISGIRFSIWKKQR